MLKADPQNRHFYEIIPEGEPCKFYLDIEWEGPADPGKIVLRHLVVELLAYVEVRDGIFACKEKEMLPNGISLLDLLCVSFGDALSEHLLIFFAETQDKVGIDLDVKIVEGTRPIPGSAGVFKHSYHLTGLNLVFANNTGPLKTFVLDFLEVHRDDKLFYANRKFIIDTSVYTKNRQLRTPLSCKLDDSTKTPLAPLEPWCGSNDIWDALVTNPAADLPVIGLEDFTTTMPPSTTKRAACRRSGARGAAHSQSTEHVPVRDEVVQGLQALLVAAGSRGCQVTPHTCPLGRSVAQSFICKNVGTRVCLVSQGEEHVHNNAWLSVEQDCTACYWCHAPSCKAKSPRYIGDLDPGLLEPEGSSVSEVGSCYHGNR